MDMAICVWKTQLGFMSLSPYEKKNMGLYNDFYRIMCLTNLDAFFGGIAGWIENVHPP